MRGSDIRLEHLLWDFREEVATGGFDRVRRRSCATGVNVPGVARERREEAVR